MKRLLLCGLLSLVLAFAPAPLSRREKPANDSWVHGRWTMCWHASSFNPVNYDTHFNPDGSYTAYASDESFFVGSWSIQGRQLTVRERRHDQPDTPTWVFSCHMNPGVQTTIDAGQFIGTKLLFARPRTSD